MIALFVTLDVKPALRERFLEAITAQGAASLEREPGCLQFDICIDNENENRFLLYEVYEDETALAEHVTTPHFAVWSRVGDETIEHAERVVAAVAVPGRASS